tara:strand:- start:146 stop:469 length:324 start_codon:yes stop_codon:yes gene_type:complete
MSHSPAIATCRYAPGKLEDVLEFLKRARAELMELRKVRVWREHVEIFDVNGDRFDVLDIGYPDTDIVVLLRSIGTSFKPDLIHRPIERDYKEFKTGRRFPWAEDRIL